MVHSNNVNITHQGDIPQKILNLQFFEALENVLLAGLSKISLDFFKQKYVEIKEIPLISYLNGKKAMVLP